MNNLQFYKARKKQLKLTNLQICELSGLPKRTVEDFFRGASANPRIDTVKQSIKCLEYVQMQMIGQKMRKLRELEDTLPTYQMKNGNGRKSVAKFCAFMAKNITKC